MPFIMIIVSILSFFLLLISVESEEKLVYTECNQTISQREFIIQSETYPNRYGENINCGYFLKGHAMCSTVFHFQFLDFDLETSLNCSKDRFEVIGKENFCSLFSGVRMYEIRKMDYLRLKFVSDSSISGRGFKILVTRLPCEGNNHLNSTLRATPKSSTGTKLNLPKCCGDFYNSRRFYLASPGFPHSNQAPSDCYYHIYRANPNICRLRIHFKYFSLGYQQGTFCESGFLEIDGKKFCGCQAELDIISQFDQFWGNVPKVIRYKSDSYARNNYNGFVIEVVQDECPVRYSPSLESNPTARNGLKGEKVPEFYFYNDQLNRISFPNATKQNIELDNNEDNKRAPKVKIDYYFFKPPEHNDPVPKINNKEFTSYLDTSENDFQLPNGNDGTKCYSWGTTQLNYLTKEVLWSKMPQCKINKPVLVSRPLPTEPKCYDIKNLKGFLNNPGYPFFYFSNLNCCYRFQKIQGYCEIRIYMHDFDLEVSPNCQKDSFILYNKFKYCGNYLLHSKFSMDLTHNQYEDVIFITDSCFCGRGFSLYFEHIPCAYPSPPTTTPHVPPMTTHMTRPTLPTSPTTPTPPIRPSCGGDITEELFQIDISNIHEQCIYNVRRLYEDVCSIKLEFMNFNLLCSIEYLLINDEQYCGNLNGETLYVDFDEENKILIHYRRQIDQSPAISNIFLRGQQLRHTCHDIPAQRIQAMETQPVSFQ